MDADSPSLYSLSLIIRGMILSIPQLLLAFVVGLIVERWGKTPALDRIAPPTSFLPTSPEA